MEFTQWVDHTALDHHLGVHLSSRRVRACKRNMIEEKLEVIPLGGVGFFGMNMMAMRCGGEAIIVDAGMGFPDEESPGVDIIIPDFSSLTSTATRSPPSF